MNLTDRELWTIIHGMGFGALFLLAFAGGLAGLYSLSPRLVTAEGISERVRRLRWGTILMAVCVWLTVIVGTYIVYPWYRAAPPETIDRTVQSEELSQYPRYWLLASEETAEYHEFAMEWKEHVAWISPLLATVVAYGVFKYGSELAASKRARKIMIDFSSCRFGSSRRAAADFVAGHFLCDPGNLRRRRAGTTKPDKRGAGRHDRQQP